MVTFVPSESARPDQIADLIKEQYILYIYIYIFWLLKTFLLSAFDVAQIRNYLQILEEKEHSAPESSFLNHKDSKNEHKHVMRALHNVVIKQEFPKNVKLLIFKAIFVPVFAYCHES